MSDYGTPPEPDECDHVWISDQTLCSRDERSTCADCGLTDYDTWADRLSAFARAGISLADFAASVGALLGRDPASQAPATGNAYPVTTHDDLSPYGFHQEDQ